MKQYDVVATKRYRKDYNRLQKAGLDVKKLDAIIDRLVAGEILPPNYRDHALRGAMQGSRECHIAPDWLLRYAKDDDALILLLISTGDHRRVLHIE